MLTQLKWVANLCSATTMRRGSQPPKLNISSQNQFYWCWDIQQDVLKSRDTAKWSMKNHFNCSGEVKISGSTAREKPTSNIFSERIVWLWWSSSNVTAPVIQTCEWYTKDPSPNPSMVVASFYFFNRIWKHHASLLLMRLKLPASPNTRSRFSSGVEIHPSYQIWLICNKKSCPKDQSRNHVICKVKLYR